MGWGHLGVVKTVLDKDKDVMRDGDGGGREGRGEFRWMDIGGELGSFHVSERFLRASAGK